MAFKKNIPIVGSDGTTYAWGGYMFLEVTKRGKLGRAAPKEMQYELESYVVDHPSTHTDLSEKSVFYDLYRSSVKSGRLPERSKDAIQWMQKQARRKRPDRNKVLYEKNRINFSGFEIGKLYFFGYDATTKEKLPYWDMYPIMYPIDVINGDILGINLHYLPYDYRAKLQDALYATVSDVKFDRETKLQISYNILKGFSAFPLVKPCIHRYKAKGIKTGIVEIPPSVWSQALFLPLKKFQKSRNNITENISDRTVYNDTKKKIRKH